MSLSGGGGGEKTLRWIVIRNKWVVPHRHQWQCTPRRRRESPWQSETKTRGGPQEKKKRRRRHCCEKEKSFFFLLLLAYKREKKNRDPGCCCIYSWRTRRWMRIIYRLKNWIALTPLVKKKIIKRKTLKRFSFFSPCAAQPSHNSRRVLYRNLCFKVKTITYARVLLWTLWKSN